MTEDDHFERLNAEALKDPTGYAAWMMPFRRRGLAKAMEEAGVETDAEFYTALAASEQAMPRPPMTAARIYKWLQENKPKGVKPSLYQHIAERLAEQKFRTELGLQFALAQITSTQRSKD